MPGAIPSQVVSCIKIRIVWYNLLRTRSPILPHLFLLPYSHSSVKAQFQCPLSWAGLGTSVLLWHPVLITVNTLATLFEVIWSHVYLSHSAHNQGRALYLVQSLEMVKLSICWIIWVFSYLQAFKHAVPCVWNILPLSLFANSYQLKHKHLFYSAKDIKKDLPYAQLCVRLGVNMYIINMPTAYTEGPLESDGTNVIPVPLLMICMALSFFIYKMEITVVVPT